MVAEFKGVAKGGNNSGSKKIQKTSNLFAARATNVHVAGYWTGLNSNEKGLIPC
jgi:hypothetical protein